MVLDPFNITIGASPPAGDIKQMLTPTTHGLLFESSAEDRMWM